MGFDPRPIVAIDFHGVICAHPEGSRGATEADWPEVPGAIEWLKGLPGRFRPWIVSARFARPGREGAAALAAARSWLQRRGIPPGWMLPGEDGEPARITLAAFKPPCRVWIDDRAWRFEGVFPSAEEIAAFKPWNR